MRCSICKRDLPQETFYPSDMHRCKECHKAEKRERHLAKTKPLYGVTRNEKGQLVSFQGRKKTIHWTGNMLSIMKRYYPVSTNAELSELLNVSVRTVVRKAKEMGLNKSQEWTNRIAKEHSLLGTVERWRNNHDNINVAERRNPQRMY